MLQPLNIPGETYEQLLARVQGSAFFMPAEKVPGAPKAGKLKKLPKPLRKLLANAANLSDVQLQLLTKLLAGEARLAGNYAVERTEAGWRVEALQGGDGGHTVNLELTECSCPDCRFRERQCKHIKLLLGAKLDA
jgi:hypothetical protein